MQMKGKSITVEHKFDGDRMLLHRDGDKITFISRYFLVASVLHISKKCFVERGPLDSRVCCNFGTLFNDKHHYKR